MGVIDRFVFSLLMAAAASTAEGNVALSEVSAFVCGDGIFSGDFEESCKGIPGLSRTAPYAGTCWIMSNTQALRSCDDICSVHTRTYSSLTASFAGSGGTSVNCSEILTRVQGSPIAVASEPEHFFGVTGLGCGLDLITPPTGVRVQSPTTPMAEQSWFQRVCACDPIPSPLLRYTPGAHALAVNQLMAPWVPTLAGTTGSFLVQPALPPGLSLNPVNGTISGTPLTLQGMTTYQVTASSHACLLNAEIGISVVTPPLIYPGSPRVLQLGTTMAPWVPEVAGATSGFHAAPTLPGGLVLNATTGTISGTPTHTQPNAQYTISATNSEGAISTTIEITVQPPPPPCNGGVQVGDRCWYLGTLNQNCAQVCDVRGGYHIDTASFAGSGGTTANCTEVLRRFVGPSLPAASSIPVLHGIGNLGCGLDPTAGPPLPAPYRLTSVTTAEASAWFFQRACACNQ